MQKKDSIPSSQKPEKSQIIFQVLLMLGICYFALFIFPNFTGARTADMLQVFEVDEYAQYPHVIRMLTAGETFYQTVRNFIIYLHYFYGYIFYFVSALMLLPLRLFSGSNWSENSAVVMVILRQGVNVLPAILSVFLLTYIQTGFRSWLRSLGIFFLLLSVPGLVVNNLWWHPDSLGLLLVTLVFFLLDRDRLQFGRFFFLAALACGAAVGTKYLGLFFCLSIPLYLIFGIANQKVSWKKALLLAGVFVLLMAAAVVVTNPLLLLPQERAALIQYQVLQYQQTMTGIMVHNVQPFFENGQYPADFRIHYGDVIFIILALAALAIGLLCSQTRLRAALMFVFMAPLSYTIFNAATRRTHYWLPVLIPLLSCLVFLFPESKSDSPPDEVPCPKWLGKLRPFFPWIAAAIMLTQFVIFIQTDIKIYQDSIQRENTSASLSFNRQITQVLSNLPEQNRKYAAYRDWHIYFPNTPRWRVEMNWDLADNAYIQELNPDLILLEKANINLFSDPSTLQRAVNPENMKLNRDFYLNAVNNKLEGYQLIYQDNFAIALIKTKLYPLIKP